MNEQHTSGLLVCHGIYQDLSLSTVYAKFQNINVAKSPEIVEYHIGMPAISPARATNVATHAWTKLYTEIILVFLSAIHAMMALT